MSIKKLQIEDFRAKAEGNKLSKFPNRLEEHLYSDKKDFKKKLSKLTREIDDLQNLMYAHDRYGLLLIFQAMDAAGKDGTIRHVFSGVNPHGVNVSSFKRPSEDELDHDFMWRTTLKAPARGTISVFNRSYYEEVLIVKVHPNIVTDYQRIPAENGQPDKNFWKQRYDSIQNYESHLNHNGIKVVKFFLNLSRDEQRDRFLARIDTPSKNWKFNSGDVSERKHWDAYQDAYQDAINATSRDEAPWYIIPADDKPDMRLIVAKVVLEKLKSLDMKYPTRDAGRREELQKYRELLAGQ